MNSVIKNLEIFDLDLKDEKTLNYLMGLCESSIDNSILYNKTPWKEDKEGTIQKTWNELIIRQIPNCKSSEDYGILYEKTSFDSKERKMVGEAWRAFVISEIRNQNLE